VKQNLADEAFVFLRYGKVSNKKLPERFVELINKCVELREALKQKVGNAGGKTDFQEEPATWKPDASLPHHHA